MREEGWAANDTDCDDADADIRPDAIEICNDIDDDCDGDVDDDDGDVDLSTLNLVHRLRRRWL